MGDPFEVCGDGREVYGFHLKIIWIPIMLKWRTSTMRSLTQWRVFLRRCHFKSQTMVHEHPEEEKAINNGLRQQNYNMRRGGGFMIQGIWILMRDMECHVGCHHGAATNSVARHSPPSHCGAISGDFVVAQFVAAHKRSRAVAKRQVAVPYCHGAHGPSSIACASRSSTVTNCVPMYILLGRWGRKA